MSAITELQREIRERSDTIRACRETFRVTYSCGHRLVSFGDWQPRCAACGIGSMRVVFKP